MGKECIMFGGLIAFCIVLITGIVLFACSFSLVQLDEYGLIYDHTYQEIEPEIHESGRYFTGEFFLLIYNRYSKKIHNFSKKNYIHFIHYGPRFIVR